MTKRERRVRTWKERGKNSVWRSPFRQGGHWRVRRRNTLTGEVTFHTLEAGTITEAKEEIKKLAEAEKKQKDLSPQSLGAALKEWVGLRAADLRPSSARDLHLCAKVYTEHFGAARLVSEIALADMEKFFHRKLKTRKGRTLLKHRQILRGFFRWCLKHGFAQENLPDLIEIPKRWRVEARRGARETGQAITLDEARALLAAADGKQVIVFKPKEGSRRHRPWTQEMRTPPWLWWLIFLSLRSGLRRGNTIGNTDRPGLLWGEVDLDEKVIRIPPERMKNGMAFLQPMHEELVEALRERLRTLGRVPAPDEPVVPAPNEANVNRVFEGALKRAGLGDRGFRPHDLRHSFISWLGQHCTHAVMQRLAGHEPTSITDNYAKHQELQVLREGINRLPRLLGDARPEAGGTGLA